MVFIATIIPPTINGLPPPASPPLQSACPQALAAPRQCLPERSQHIVDICALMQVLTHRTGIIMLQLSMQPCTHLRGMHRVRRRPRTTARLVMLRRRYWPLLRRRRLLMLRRAWRLWLQRLLRWRGRRMRQGCCTCHWLLCRAAVCGVRERRLLSATRRPQRTRFRHRSLCGWREQATVRQWRHLRVNHTTKQSARSCSREKSARNQSLKGTKCAS